MGPTADQLRQEIDQKRDDAASKIDQIESRVQDTTQSVKDAVQDIPQMAKETVSDTVEQVKESVQNIDFNRQIQERPLVALGAAIAGGFLLGGVMGGGGGGGQSSGGQSSGGSQGGIGAGIRSAAKSSGLEDQLSGVTGALMGMVTERVRSVVQESLPQVAERMQPGQSSAPSGGGVGVTASAADSSDRVGLRVSANPDRSSFGG